MVEETAIKGKKYFVCEECKLVYRDREWAEKCQNWCRKHHACNIEIIGHSVDVIKLAK